MLQAGSSPARRTLPFALLFLAAALSRGLSVHYLTRYSEPELLPQDERCVGWRDFLGRLRRGDDGRLLLFVLAAQIAVQIASPYFTPYMLRQLQLPYGSYVALLIASYGAKIVALPLFGRMARRFGARRMLLLAGIAIVPLPVLWLLSDSLPALIAVNLISGCAWAAYELATFLLLFETIRESERTSLLTTFNVLHAAATVGGALLGGAILAPFGPSHSAYVVLFGVSALARGVSLILVRRLGGTARARVAPEIRHLAARPQLEAALRPILPSLPRLRPNSRSMPTRRAPLPASMQACRRSVAGPHERPSREASVS